MGTLKPADRNQMDFYGQQQQPMSLMTISRGQLTGPETWRPGRVGQSGLVDANDLLTLRILEASERKMLMIKELLSPEEFRSVASNLAIDRESARMSSGDSRVGVQIETGAGADLATSAQDRNQSTSSLVEDRPPSSRMKRVRFSRSETNLTVAQDNSNDIKLSLGKRKKAVEFFLGAETSGDKDEIKMPAFESRFGEYLKPNEEQERILTSHLANGSLGHLFALIWALLLWIGDSLSLTSKPPDGGGQDKVGLAEFEAAQFIELHRALNWAPYTRERNMRAAAKRFQADEALAKLVRASRPHLRRSLGEQQVAATATGRNKQEMITLIRRKSYRNRVKLKLIDLERNRWIALRSFGPRLLSDNSHSSPLLGYASFGLWAQICEKLFRHQENLDEPLGELTRQPNRAAPKSRVDIRFERISIDEHKLIRPEVRLAKRLIGVYDQYELLVVLVDRASSRVIEHVSERYSNGTTATQSLNSNWLLKLLSLLQFKCNLLTRLNMKQMKLGDIWADIKLVRSSNSCRLTGIQLGASPSGGQDLLSQRAAQTLMRGPLTMSLMSDLGKLQDAEEQVDLLRSLIEIEQRLADELSALKRLKLDRAVSSARQQSSMSAEDSEASKNLAIWFDSLNFTAIVRADCSGRRLHVETRGQNNSLQMDDLHRLEVASSRSCASSNTLTFTRPVSGAPLARLELDIEIEQKSRGSSGSLAGLIFSRGHLLKRAKFEVPIRSDIDQLVGDTNNKPRVDHYEVKIELAAAASDDEDEDKVEASDERNPVISIEFSVMQALDTACEVDVKQLSRRLLVDRLYAALFKSDHSRLLDTESKIAKLINQIEPTCLLSLMSELDLMTNSSRSSPTGANYCVLDAFMPHFRPSTTCHSLANFRPASLRLALLSRRWTKLIARNQFEASMEPLELDRVFISEHENRRKLLNSERAQFVHDLNPDLIHEQLRWQLRRNSSDQELDVARGIEQKRAAALEYIRRLDSLIGQLLETRPHTEQPVSAGALPASGDSSRLAGDSRSLVDLKREQLLIEPTIRLRRPKLNVSVDVLLLVRSLVPRPTARRPLMPRRRRQDESSSLGRSSRLARIVRRTRSDLGQDGWLADSLASPHSHLRLIVTIQRASNVPYRLVSPPAVANFGGGLQSGSSLQTNLLYPMGLPAFTRSSSPLFSPSPMMMLGGAGASSPLPSVAAASQTAPFQRQQQQPPQVLMPATTYVEANFQRKQLASSLAQGKDPAWNETLFFEVMDEDKSNDDRRPLGERPGMHLADECLQLNLYDCRSFVQDGDGPPVETYDLVGPNNQAASNAAGGAANRLLVARRRIERHLIGSLSVPMSALLTTSGRVEGSFSLSQPLLLDNYQHEPMDSMALQTGAISQHARADRAAGDLGELATGGGSSRSSGIHLSVFITLDPPVSFPLGVKLPAAGSHERRDLFELAQLWERVMFRLSPRDANRSAVRSGNGPIGSQSHNRTDQSHARSQAHIRALVLRDDARYCLISRHLRPLSPPRDLVERQDTKAAVDSNQDEDEDESHLLRLLSDDQPDEGDDRMRRLARFVSLLSPLKYGLFKIRPLASGLWFDSGQLLSDHLGGPEEKAVLLCNYFLHLGKCSGLALGESLTSGRCVYVLVWPDRMRSDRPQANPVHSQQVGAAPNSIHAGNFLERLPILVQARNCHLWDPNSGCRHKLAELAHHENLSSSSLPLVSIGSIVTPENVYANLQSAPINRLDLDPRQRSHWFPLFRGADGATRSGANESEQVERNCALVRRESRRIIQTNSRRKRLAQLEQLARAIGRPAMEPASLAAQLGVRDLDQGVYESYTASQCQQLSDKLERTIKSNLLTWRPTRPTYFNRTLSRIIADKLASFERNLLARDESPPPPAAKYHQLALADPDWWRAELADLLRLETSAMASLGAAGFSQPERRLISWPANLAYTSLEPIIDSLFASGVHNADLLLESSPSGSSAELGGQPSSAQFLVAVHVEAYPARVMSVWLFVGVIVTVK